MSREQSPGSDALPPHAQLIQMGTGSWVSAIVYAAAKLGLADHLAAGPKSAAELAGATRHARTVAASLDAHAGQPRHPHRTRRAAVRADAARRGAQDRRARLGASHAAGVLAASGSGAAGRRSLYSLRNRQDRLREGVRHADLRVPGATPGGRVLFQ